MKTEKRSQQKRITKQAEVLRYLRRSRGISMRKVGDLIGISYSTVSHYEHGRIDLDDGVVRRFVESYGHTMAEFQEFIDGKPVPVIRLRDECIHLLDRIDEAKMRAVHAVLVSFVSK